MKTTKIIAEIGINYAYGNDSSLFLDNVKKLIDVAAVAGADYVKFQKRDPELCVPEHQKSKPKRVPWRNGETTYLQYKKDIELNANDFDEINDYCISKSIGWFVSVWDKNSVDFMDRWRVKYPTHPKLGKILKIPSPLITDLELCSYARKKTHFLMISTGMSTEEQVIACVDACSPDLIMHTNSTYPAPLEELNLDYITWLKHKYGEESTIGYSGHEFGLMTTIATTLMGAEWIERHITLDRALWGSDQLASVEPQGLIKLIKSIRDIELARGGYGDRKVLGGELKKMKSLRK